jgi:hypothetical protein
MFPAILTMAVVVSAQILPTIDFEKASCLTDAAGLVRCGFSCTKSARGVVGCASEPGGACIEETDGTVTCSKPLGITLRLPLLPATCIDGADGSVGCGYDCVVGADGRVACANSPDGACAVAPGGKAVCSRFNLRQRIMVLTDPVRPSCLRSADGGVGCGFSCVKDSRGRVRCANTPDGACRQDTTGTVTCTTFDPNQRIFLGAPPQSECLRGATGHAVCGYGCVRDTVGVARCSSSPFGACAARSDGHVVCWPDEEGAGP